MWPRTPKRSPLSRAAVFLCLLMLAGCATERGDILASDPRDYTDASFLEVPDDEYFWLQPPPAGSHAPLPPELQVPKQGLWLKAGWINVESQCFTPKKAKRTAYPIFPDYAQLAPVYILPGRRYLLKCDDYVVGKFNLLETGPLPGY